MELTGIEEYAWNVAIKKIISSVIIFLASKQVVLAFGWLSAHGITIAVDPAKFETTFTALGIGAFAGAHDWLRMKFPNKKWL